MTFWDFLSAKPWDVLALGFLVYIAVARLIEMWRAS